MPETKKVKRAAQKRWDDAVLCLTKDINLEARNNPVYRPLGSARLKQNDKAFEMPGKAVDEGFSNRNSFETDGDLAPLRVDERFQTLLARSGEAARTEIYEKKHHFNGGDFGR